MAKSWNWFRDGDQRRGFGEPSILAGLTRQVMDDFDVDPTRVYVAGLSSGGAAAAVMAMNYPDLYAAVGIHSGLACGSAGSTSAALMTMRRGALFRPSQATHPVPTIVFHGDRDRTVAPVNGDQVIAQVKPDTDVSIATDQGRSEGGMAYTRTIRTAPHSAWSSEQWVLHGGGHAWAGGTRQALTPTPPDPMPVARCCGSSARMRSTADRIDTDRQRPSRTDRRLSP